MSVCYVYTVCAGILSGIDDMIGVMRFLLFFLSISLIFGPYHIFHIFLYFSKFNVLNINISFLQLMKSIGLSNSNRCRG